LIDGARIADTAQRTNAQAEASNIVEAFLDAGMLEEGCRVEFVVSKFDRVLAPGDASIAFLQATETKITRKFSGRIPYLGFRRIAARPDIAPGSDPHAHEFADAFRTWATPLAPSAQSVLIAETRDDGREFARYGE